MELGSLRNGSGHPAAQRESMDRWAGGTNEAPVWNASPHQYYARPLDSSVMVLEDGAADPTSLAQTRGLNTYVRLSSTALKCVHALAQLLNQDAFSVRRPLSTVQQLLQKLQAGALVGCCCKLSLARLG